MSERTDTERLDAIERGMGTLSQNCLMDDIWTLTLWRDDLGDWCDGSGKTARAAIDAAMDAEERHE